MKRLRDLDKPQKIILALLLIMVLVFSILYPLTISRVGFEYMDTILVVSQENGSTVYSGKINGEKARFTVSEDKSVMFTCGDKSYGPFTVVEDPTAVPDDSGSRSLTGIDLREGDEVLFRGGIDKRSDDYNMYPEDDSRRFTSRIGQTMEDENGNVIDSLKPSAATIVALIDGPELMHKGDSFIWLMCTLLCIINAVTILFADELFYFWLQFRIRNSNSAKPADAEIAGRYFRWTVVALITLGGYIVGLTLVIHAGGA